jgi:DNA replication protein DnaC
MRKEDEKNEEAKRILEIANKRRHWRMTCGIPPLFMNKGFGTYDKKREGNIKKTYDKCLAYAEGFPLEYHDYIIETQQPYPSMVLFSDNWGVGKSHLVCSIAHKIIDRWSGEDIMCPVKFVSEPDLYREFYRAFDKKPQGGEPRLTEDDIILSLVNPSLLILDDVGKETRSDPRFVQRILFSVIEGRYKKLKPIVLTSNLVPDSLKDYLGGEDNQASFERLWEMCGGAFWQIKGESYRRVK